MNLISRKQKNERRRQMSGNWKAKLTTDRAENKLFDATFELSEAAREFDQTAGVRRTAPVTAASLACTASALDSQANALHRMRSLVRFELSSSGRDTILDADLEEFDQVFKRIEENLRFAANESYRARQLADRILNPPDPSEQSPVTGSGLIHA